MKVPFITRPGEPVTFVVEGPDGKKYELRPLVSLVEVEAKVLPAGVHFEWKHAINWELRPEGDPTKVLTPPLPTGSSGAPN